MAALVGWQQQLLQGDIGMKQESDFGPFPLVPLFYSLRFSYWRMYLLLSSLNHTLKSFRSMSASSTLIRPVSKFSFALPPSPSLTFLSLLFPPPLPSSFSVQIELKLVCGWICRGSVVHAARGSVCVCRCVHTCEHAPVCVCVSQLIYSVYSAHWFSIIPAAPLHHTHSLACRLPPTRQRH